MINLKIKVKISIYANCDVAHYDTQPMTLVSGNIPPLVRLLQAYIEKGSKVIIQEKKEVTKGQQNVVGIILVKYSFLL